MKKLPVKLPIEQVAIPMLMSRPKVPWEWGKQQLILKAEQKLSIVCADKLRGWVDDGSYQGIWFGVRNEGKRGALEAIVARAMGLIPGVSDFFCAGPWGAGGLELKCDDNTMTDEQCYFRWWCEQWGIGHATARSPEKFESTLREWGALKASASVNSQ